LTSIYTFPPTWYQFAEHSKVTLHDLRRTFTTGATARGLNSHALPAISDIMVAHPWADRIDVAEIQRQAKAERQSVVADGGATETAPAPGLSR
jgi:hypothetical protein